MKPQIILTADGSHSLYNAELNETYHSKDGALAESQYVYIQNGLEYLMPLSKKFNLLEVGFGTGLNALLTFDKAEKNKLNIHYTALEPYPLSLDVVQSLNYSNFFTDYQYYFHQMHQCLWTQKHQLSEYFVFQKFQQKLEDFSSDALFDLIFFDAFAPSKQASVWSLENFKKLYGLMSEDAVLVSYGSSGQFKRNLKEAGFRIDILPGPMRKREMVRAIK